MTILNVDLWPDAPSALMTSSHGKSMATFRLKARLAAADCGLVNDVSSLAGRQALAMKPGLS